VILVDTHIWIWWVLDVPRLSPAHRLVVEAHQSDAIGVSVISCWEVAKLVQIGRLILPLPVGEWMEAALAYPGVRLIELTPRIAVASTLLPGEFHRDPADQIIVATARQYDCELVTVDESILNYPHVRTIAP
jgi:PIN domain nuclease of toxin-antitoxin system